MKDWTYEADCGCNVTFFAASLFRTSRLLPGEGCTRHDGMHNVEGRDALIERAKRERDEYITQLNDQYR